MDHVNEKNKISGLVVSWGNMVVPAEIISLPQITQEQAGRIKEEYLKWIYDLGKTEIRGQSLISYLKIFDNLSFWWLTSIAEKSPFLCESIFQIFKLRALEKIYFDNHCRSLVYRGNNKCLHSTLRNWLVELGHSYKWIPISSNRPKSSTDSINKILFKKLPHRLQGLAWLIKRWLERWRHVNPSQSSN